MSNWVSITLGNAFPTYGANTQAQRDALNKRAQELQLMIDRLSTELGNISNAVGVSNQTLQSLALAGVNFLAVEPGEGGIMQRIESAGNQPPSIGQVYSCAIVIAFQAPSMAQVVNNYQAIKRVIDFNF
jgi:hypothetical protein